MTTEGDDRQDDLRKGAADTSDLVRIRDVIVCAADTADQVPLDEVRAHPPVGWDNDLFPEAVPEIDLGEGIKLTTLPDDEAEEIMDACTPRGRRFEPVRQFSQRYSFVRERTYEEVDGSGTYFNPDEDGKLFNALSLSRLIRDNGFSLQYTARMLDHGNGERTIAYRASSEGNAAYRLLRGREWLDGPEAEDLRALLDAYRAAELPSRVTRAMWRLEYATRLAWADVMLPTLIGGLEALLKVGRGYPTRQFKVRATALADELGVPGVNEDLCARMYDGRSDWVHGSHVRLLDREGSGGAAEAEQSEVLEQIAAMRNLLRVAARRSIEDPAFRQVFASVPEIERRWPVPPPPRRGIWGWVRRRLRQLID